jgi:glycosyltransferase involved in cell wall biosynthesis
MELIKSSKLQAFIITKNEDPNIKRVLDKLTWLERVYVLDSYSTDDTIKILETYPNVKLAYRTFDTFAGQCNYGLAEMDSEWVLSLDADYVLTEDFIKETKEILKSNPTDVVAYYTKFEFLIYGKQLLSNNTTPRAVLFKRSAGSYFNDGHAHRLDILGKTGFYRSRILHDDRKSLSRWLSNQDGYSVKECRKLLEENSPDSNSLIFRIRRTRVLAPFLVFFHCLFIKGLIFNGWAGWYYTLQRTMVEILFAIRLIEDEKLK